MGGREGERERDRCEMAGFVFFCTKRNLERKREGKGGRERENVVGNYLQQEFAVVRSLGEMSIRLRTAAAAAVKPCDKESAAIKTASAAAAAAAAKRGGEGREGLDLAGGEADAAAAGQ